MLVAFVSVNQSYEAGMDANQLAAVAQRAWALSLSKARDQEFLVAVYEQRPLMAWPVLDAYTTEETWTTKGGARPRVGFALGSPVPVRPEWNTIPDMRRGIVYIDR